MQKIVTMTFTRATKNTFRFDEPGDEPLIGNLYIQKSAFDGTQPPAQIEVTVKA